MVFQLPVQEVRVVPASVQVISHLGIPSPPVTIMAEHVFFFATVFFFSFWSRELRFIVISLVITLLLRKKTCSGTVANDHGRRGQQAAAVASSSTSHWSGEAVQRNDSIVARAPDGHFRSTPHHQLPQATNNALPNQGMTCC
jgi:hypothetical protein